MIRVSGLAKTFVLHTQGGVELPVFAGLELAVSSGECVALHGESGSGKSTLLRALYGNYKASDGIIEILHEGRWIDLVSAAPREILAVRRSTVGYVSQFLHVVPRVATRDIVAEPLIAAGVAPEEARDRADRLLSRLRISERLRRLPPATFSGGEQQRVNIARGFGVSRPILLLDEPTASLDATNRDTVIELIGEAKAQGSAIVGIFHDRSVRDAVADRVIDLERFRSSA